MADVRILCLPLGDRRIILVRLAYQKIGNTVPYCVAWSAARGLVVIGPEVTTLSVLV